MSDLDTRLRNLKQPTVDGPSASVLRERAAARRRRRRRLQAGAVVTTAVCVGVILSWRDEPDDLVTGPGPTTAEPSPAQRTLGGVDGVTVTVEPRTGLRDGELVHVRIDGLSALPGASVVQCAGDVTDDTALESCDLGVVEATDGPPGVGFEAMAEQTVAVARTIHIIRGSPDPNVPRAYDCATEPAGCVLAVGPLTLPARAVLVDLDFVDGPVPTGRRRRGAGHRVAGRSSGGGHRLRAAPERHVHPSGLRAVG